jgi:hypothetical protein
MYLLSVFHPDREVATVREHYRNAAEAMRAIPVLLEAHPGCARIDVYASDSLLFSVDCEGQTLKRVRV